MIVVQSWRAWMDRCRIRRYVDLAAKVTASSSPLGVATADLDAMQRTASRLRAEGQAVPAARLEAIVRGYRDARADVPH